MEAIQRLIADVPDFPKPGIVFKDITPVLLDAGVTKQAITALVERAAAMGATRVAGIESRGFIFGVPVALEMDLGFIPLRKPSKLPRETLRAAFQKEYGEDAIEMHSDACGPGDRVLIVDDLLATGGTAQAAAELIRSAGAEVAGFVFVVELGFLKGRERLGSVPIEALLVY